MTHDPTLIEQVAPCPFCGEPLSVPHRVNPMGRCDTEGCWMHERAYTVVLDDPRQVAAWNARAGQGSAALPSERVETMAREAELADLRELIAAAALPSEAMIAAGTGVLFAWGHLTREELMEILEVMRATTPTAPVQDDDAGKRIVLDVATMRYVIERLEAQAQLHSGANSTIIGQPLRRIAQNWRELIEECAETPSLSPTPETDLVEALKSARPYVLDVASGNGAAEEAVVADATLNAIDAALSNVSPDEAQAKSDTV